MIKFLGIAGQSLSVLGVIIFFLTGNLILKAPRRNLVDLIVPFLLAKDSYTDSEDEYKRKRVKYFLNVLSIIMFLVGSAMLIYKEIIS
jgi:hypothetical protein